MMNNMQELVIDKSDVVEVGKRVIRIEAAALDMLADDLSGSFADAVNAIYVMKGRLVLTGVGKSAHVARKITATLASTGTPAYFVHATEASHGDLGMIAEDDVVVALSNSGETRELSDLVQYCVRFSITLIAITGEPKSMLGAAAKICLVISDAEEACKETSAPTSSTTMMMALGDAIAVALIERRGFKAMDFKLFHPGGSLGSALMKVSDVMHSDEEIPLVSRSAEVSAALLEMTSKGFGCAGIVGDKGELVGVITDGDLRRHMGSTLLDACVEEIMTTTPRTITSSALLGEALRIMTIGEQKITAVFVLECGRPIGVVHIHDCLRVGLS